MTFKHVLQWDCRLKGDEAWRYRVMQSFKELMIQEATTYLDYLQMEGELEQQELEQRDFVRALVQVGIPLMFSETMYFARKRMVSGSSTD